MSLKHKRSVFSIKKEQSVIFFNKRKEKKEIICELNGVSMQISDICKDKKKIMKLADNLETNSGLK